MVNGGKEVRQSYHIVSLNDELEGTRLHQNSTLQNNTLSDYLLNNVCWFYPPKRDWSLSWYLSLRGGENFHIYIWILKDLAWAQSWYWAGHIFGGLAIVWSLYLCSHALKLRNINEIWASAAQTLWFV